MKFQMARSALASIVMLLIGGATLRVARAQSLPDESYDPYLGTYEFEDGLRVTGGRMDEGGATMLVYIDTETVARAGVFERTKNGFAPAFDIGGASGLAFEDGGRVMLWHDSAGRLLEAERVMHPTMRAAEFSNGDVVLRGALYLPPDADRPLPAVVLAHGSGPATRYAGPWITFFLEQGLAVLSYDKRGTGESGGAWETSTYLELAEDLSAGVDWLRRQSDIETDRVGVHTSSQSGWYGPHTATTNPGVAFLIQRAGPAVDIGVGTAHEIREEWRAEGLSVEVIEPAFRFWLELHRLAREKASLEEARKLTEEAVRKPWFEPAFGDWFELDSGWWERHVANMQLDPGEDVAKLAIPVLWFLAEEDENVPYAASLRSLETAQESNPELKVVTVHGAAHSFVVTAAAGPPRYTDEYWQVMAEWLSELHVAAAAR